MQEYVCKNSIPEHCVPSNLPYSKFVSSLLSIALVVSKNLDMQMV